MSIQMNLYKTTKKISSSRHKRHQQQSKFYCLLMNFYSSSEKFIAQHLNENIIKITNNEKQDRYFNRSLFYENYFILFSNFVRGPPKLEIYSNFI